MLAITILLIAVLVFVAIDDFLNFQIKNESISVLLLLICLKYFFSGLPADYILRMIVALVVFSSMLLAHWRGYLGGGDVKLLPLAFLWLGSTEWLLFYAILTVATLLYSILALLKILPSDMSKGKPRMAYGPCISIAWIMCIILNR